jgi:hypothetical protein
MTPTAPFKAVPGKPLPSLLISVALMKSDVAAEAAKRASFADRAPVILWPPPVAVMPNRSQLTAYEIRLHLYQAAQ